MFTKLTEKLESFLAKGIPGYDCIVYHHGKCVYRRYNGYADLVAQEPMTGKERYFIYSCSKVITCVAALQLYEKGLFQLEDELSRYMPEFETMYVKTESGLKKTERSIKIKDLFCMTAGFSYDFESPSLLLAREETQGRCPTRETMKYLAKEPLLFEPGDHYNYSLCHDVLAALVEVLSGVPFNDYVKQNIFDVLGMKDSTYIFSEVDVDTICNQYRYDTEKKEVIDCGKVNPYILGTEYASGGAGCISTVEDYIKFLEALRQGNVILKNETIQLMASNQLTPDQAKTYLIEGYDYGYGLGVRCFNGNERFTDFGWGGVAGAHLIIDRKYDYTAFYAQHVLGSLVPVNDLAGVIRDIVHRNNKC